MNSYHGLLSELDRIRTRYSPFLKTHHDYFIHPSLRLQIHSYYAGYFEVFDRFLFAFHGCPEQDEYHGLRITICPSTSSGDLFDRIRSGEAVLKHRGTISNHVPYHFYESSDMDIAVVNNDTFIFYRYDQAEAFVCIDKKHEHPMNFYVTQCVLTPILNECFRRNRAFLLHASGVEINNSSLLFIGSGGAGKTTLSLYLVRNGFRFLGDDLVLISREGDTLKAFSFPIPIHITMNTVRYFPELEKLTDSDGGWKKQFFRIDRIFPGCIAEKADPGILFFIGLKPGGMHRIEKIQHAEAYRRLMAASFFVTNRQHSRNHFQMLSELIDSTEWYTLSIAEDMTGLDELITGTIR